MGNVCGARRKAQKVARSGIVVDLNGWEMRKGPRSAEILESWEGWSISEKIDKFVGRVEDKSGRAQQIRLAELGTGGLDENLNQHPCITSLASLLCEGFVTTR